MIKVRRNRQMKRPLHIMIKRYASLVLAATMTFVLAASPSVFATESEDELNSVQEQQNDAKESLEEIKTNITKYENQLSELGTQQTEIQTQINAKQDEINQINDDIEAKQAEIDDRNDGLGKRLRTMYKNGTVSYIDIVLDSQNFSELLSNVYMLQRIYRSDQDTVAKLQSAYDELQTKKDDLAQAQAELQASRDDLDSKQSEIKTATASLNEEKSKVQAQIDAFQEQINSLNDKIAAEQAAAEAERRAAQEAAQNTDGGSGDVVQVIGSGVLSWPVNGPITSYFGHRVGLEQYGTWHGALDIGCAHGTPIRAADSGTVMSLTGWYEQGYGWGVFIDHGNGLVTVYGHNSQLLVSPGDHVEKGQVIAYAGATGWATGPHCHFEVRVNGVCVDPLLYLS